LYHYVKFAGVAVAGISDTDWTPYIEDSLGVDFTDMYVDLENTMPWVYKTVDRGGPRMRLKVSSYALRLKWLRQKFNYALTYQHDDETVARYTRAFCMDLFGSVMFPDSSENGVPAMYLQFIADLDTPQNYNWGGAVLAHLYRELSRACKSGESSISGPMLLLQIWSWTRFAIGRPTRIGDPPDLGGTDLDKRNAFGVKWISAHAWPNNTHAGGILYLKYTELF